MVGAILRLVGLGPVGLLGLRLGLDPLQRGLLRGVGGDDELAAAAVYLTSVVVRRNPKFAWSSVAIDRDAPRSPSYSSDLSPNPSPSQKLSPFGAPGRTALVSR